MEGTKLLWNNYISVHRVGKSMLGTCSLRREDGGSMAFRNFSIAPHHSTVS